MAPRRRTSSKPLLQSSKARKTLAAIFRKRARCWKYCEPFCYAFAALLVLITLILLTIFLMALFPVTIQKIKSLVNSNNMIGKAFNLNELPTQELFLGEQTPCTQMSVNKVWSKALSRLNTESPIRKIDLNGDGIVDVIFGYGVDDSIQYQLDNSHGAIPKCEISNEAGYRELVFCEGGIIALDGTNGNTIWQHWTSSIIFSLICSADFNKDKQMDCVASGRGGVSKIFFSI